MLIKLTKIKDDAFNGNHPNGVNEGYVFIGEYKKPPTFGDTFIVYGKKMWDILETSIVLQPLNEDNIFKTTYSTYKIEYLKHEN
jgi:hypothetical protein